MPEAIQDVIQSVYVPVLQSSGFVPTPQDHRFGPNGLCWRLEGDAGEGYFWTYGQKDLFDIKIHDFFFYQDSFLEFRFPKCLSVTYYESFSGEELSPHRRFCGGCVKAFLGGEGPYRVLVHREVPVKCIGIEVTPAYYERYLREQYPEEYVHPREAFCQLDQTDQFPEMVRLLQQVRSYRGEGIAAKLFYEGKVAEAVALVVERSRRKPQAPALAPADRRQLELLTAYIEGHCAEPLAQAQLVRVACMSATKMKKLFRQYQGCTITEYIQRCRMHKAAGLLGQPGTTVGQAALAVGYQSASRFAELFRKNTGLLPAEYQRMACGGPQPAPQKGGQ